MEKTASPVIPEQGPITDELLEKINAYWRAANYLSACQLYLLENPLLKKPLTREMVKKKIVGHWGTVPGQNFVFVHLNRVIKRGLLRSGRQQTLCIELQDKPGQLVAVSKIIADLGANVISVHHERAGEGSDVTAAYLRIVIETRNFEHVRQISDALTGAGFKLV